jgi:hypothetical protein
LFERALSLPEI